MTTWVYTVREVRRRPWRALLTLCGVAIGVAVLVGATTAIQAARGAYRDLFDSAGSANTLEVVASGRGGFDGGFAARLAVVSGVRTVRPRILTTAALTDESGATPLLVVGCADDAGARLDAHTAMAHGWAAGTRLHLWTPTGPAELPLDGLVPPRGGAALTGAAVLHLPLATAQRLFALPDQVNSVEIIVADTANIGQVETAISRHLPAGLILQPPARRGELARSTLSAVEQGLTALCLVALVAAGFVVLNTVLLNLTERRQQLALLRALGATRRQVSSLLWRETAVLGLAGGALGTAMGQLFAYVLNRALGGFLSVQLPPPRVSPWLLGLGLLAGPSLCLAATGIAAWCAGRRALLPDLIGVRGTVQETRGGRRRFAGLALLGVAALVDLGLCRGWWRGRWGPALLAPGVAALLAGCALAMPVILPWILSGIGSLLRHRIECRLAECQLLRRPTRTALTAGVLFLAMVSAVGFGHWLTNSLADLRRWYGQTIVADYLVRGSMPDSCFLLATALPEALADQLQELPGVAHVDKIAFLPATVNGTPVLVLARSVAPDRPLPIDLRTGDLADARRRLRAGEVVIGTTLARHLGIKRGDVVRLEARDGPAALRVAGTATEYAGGGDALYLEWTTAKRLLHVVGPHALLVTARPGAAAALAAPLGPFCDRHRVLLQSNQDLRAYVDGLMARITGALWTLATLTFVVAALGAANTLTMNVLEQARELSVLRGLGMTTGQMRRMVLMQAVLLGLVSLGPGAVAGVGLAWLILRAANAVSGQETVFAVSLPLTTGCFIVGMLVTVTAALLPAWYAPRLSTARA